MRFASGPSGALTSGNAMTKKIRTSLAVIFFFLMIGLVAYNIQRNPTDGAQKLIAMEKTAATLLNLGGNVVGKKQNSK